MHVTTVTAVTTILPALATLSTGIDRTARVGKRVRLYRPEGALLQSSPVVEAITLLLKQGYSVKVYEGDRIYAPTVSDGAVVWSFRTTSKTRATVVVEVKL